MKMLFDQNLSFKLCARLADVFPHSNQPTEVIEQLLRDHAEAIRAFAQDIDAACLEVL